MGDDTYLLILRLHYKEIDYKTTLFRFDVNKQSKEHKVYTILLLKKNLYDTKRAIS